METWRQRLAEEIDRRQLPVRLVDPPTAGPSGWSAAGGTSALDPDSLGLGPVPQRPLNQGWARSSYTSWTTERQPREAPGPSPAPSAPWALPPASDLFQAEALEEGRDVDDPGLEDEGFPPLADGAAPEPEAASPWPERGLWADLPAGSGFGDSLHRLLERIDYDGSLTDPDSLALAEHELRRAGLRETLAEPLLAAVRQMLATPFGGPLGTLRPADLPVGRRLNELQFDLSLQQARASDLARAFHSHPGGPFGATYAEALARLPVRHHGFLTGSIDLVFPVSVAGEDQWWVLDWKSNRLGRRDERGQCVRCGPGDYGPEALRTLMESHHYPLQAHLYLVALHRYLAWRLPAYDPERHLGGYVYVFARGTPGEAAAAALPGPVPGMLVDRPPTGRLLALDQALGSAPAGWQPGTIP